MAHFHGVVEASEVGDDAHAKHADATVARHDDLRYGRHAHGVATHDAEHTVLGGCFKCGALYAGIHAVAQGDAFLLGNLVGHGDELMVVRLMHVGEAWAGGNVLSAQRMLGEEVEVVGDDHEVADVELRIHASGGVAHKERLDAELIHDTHGECYFLHGVALVEMEASLHGHDVLASQLAEDEFACVALNGRYGEVGYVLVRYLGGISYLGS